MTRRTYAELNPGFGQDGELRAGVDAVDALVAAVSDSGAVPALAAARAAAAVQPDSAASDLVKAPTASRDH